MYPIKVDRNSIQKAGAIPADLAAFDEVASLDGILEIPSREAHACLLQGPLAALEHLLVREGILPPVSIGTGTEYAIVAAGFRGDAATGRGGVAVAGGHGHAVAGSNGVAVVGSHGDARVLNAGGVAVAGDYGTASTGPLGAAVAGYGGTAVVYGHGGTAVAEREGKASTGDRGISVAGLHGTATTREGGIALAGDNGVVAAGEGGVIMVAYPKEGRTRVAVAHVGEGGILPNVKYRLDHQVEPPVFVPVPPEDDEV